MINLLTIPFFLMISIAGLIYPCVTRAIPINEYKITIQIKLIG
jgi:hypothetical protein